MTLRIGIDLGGTKIEGVVLDRAGLVRARLRVSTPAGSYTDTVAAIATVVRSLEKQLQCPPLSVGCATPGAPSRVNGLMKNCNSSQLNGRPLQADLEAALERPLRLANDADCLVLSETLDGAASGADCVFGVILGTGVGGGVVIDGRLRQGPNAIAGEWGHNPLPWASAAEHPGPGCWCGQTGCMESWLSGPALAADHLRCTGRRLSGEQIVAAAASGDADCNATLARHASRLARALASVINLLDPEVIVLGGGLSRIERLYREVPALWGQWVFSDRVDTRLVAARHGDASGVRGAAWLWP